MGLQSALSVTTLSTPIQQPLVERVPIAHLQDYFITRSMKNINVKIAPNKIIGRLMNIEHNPKTNSFGMLRFHGSRFASDLLTEK